MLKLHYSRQTVEANLKDTIEELAGVFSRFDKLNEEAKKDYIENSYAPKVVGIASNLNELAIRPLASAPENFDPRYVQEYKDKAGSWTQETTGEKAKINQSLIDFLEKYKIAKTPEARFILYNSLLYLDGKEVNGFRQRKVEVAPPPKPASRSTRLKNFIIGRFRHAPSLDTNAMAEISEKPFDYLECPFDGSMKGFCSSTFAKDDKKVYARFAREEFEEYMLKRTYDELALELDGQSVKEKTLVEELPSRKIKGAYSDSAVERLEKRLDSSLVASLFLTSALKNAVRTKTRLSFDGKGRDYFLAETGLIGDELCIAAVGNHAFSSDVMWESGPNYKIGKLKVGRAGNEFGEGASFTADIIELGEVGNTALAVADGPLNHKIGKLTIGRAGYEFGKYASFTAGTIEAGEVGDHFLSGGILPGRWNKSSHRIGKLKIGVAGTYLGAYTPFTADVIELGEVEHHALSGCGLNHRVGKLAVGRAGYKFGEDTNLDETRRSDWAWRLEDSKEKLQAWKQAWKKRQLEKTSTSRSGVVA